MLKKLILTATLLLSALNAWAADDTAETRPLFLRGEMNNWEAPEAYQLAQQEPGVLMAKAELKASHGAYKFKFADAKWKGDTTFGQFDPTAKLTLASPIQAKAGYQWSDMRFTPEADGTYGFVLDRRDPKHIQVSIKQL